MPPPLGVAADERLILVLDLGGARPGAVATTLGLSRFEAQQRIRRGSLDLWRIGPEEEARIEVARLEAAGVTVIAIPEAEVRGAKAPLVATGGGLRDGALEVRVEGAERVRADGRDLFFVVEGAITREYAPSSDVRKVRIASPEAGYRIHLHRRRDPRPLELDPDGFDFGDSVIGRSSLLTLREWVRAVAPGVTIDDGFKRVPPALAPARMEDSLKPALTGRSRAVGARKGDATVVLDNVDQFRFYSSWRAAVERRRS